MTDLASLAIEIDSRDVKPAVAELDKLSASAKKTEGAVDSMGREWVKASSEAGKLRMESIGAAMAAEKLAAASKGASGEGARLAASAGAQKAGMQQLGYRLGDIATMYAMGAKPMQIFASQSGQVLGAVQLLTGGTSRLAAFLGGPWGIAISFAAVALSPFIAKLFETSAAADTARSALQALIEKQRQQAGEAVSLAQSQIGLNKLVEERLALEIKIDKRRARNKQYGAAPDSFLFADLKRQEELNWQVAEAQSAVRIAVSEAEKATTKATKAHEAATPKVKAHTGAAKAHAAAISDTAKAYDSAVSASKQYLESLNDQIAKFGKSAIEIHNMEVAAKAAAAPTKELAAAIREAGDALSRLMKIRDFIGDDWATPIDLGDVGEKIKREFDYREKAQRELDEANRDRALNTANDIADIIGGGVGDVLRELANVLDTEFPEFMSAIGSILGDLKGGIGELLSQFGKGAKVGSSVDGILDSIGIKSSNKGAQIGGAAGNAIGTAIGGPVGGAIGSIVGSLWGGIIGGMLKKTPKASATVSIIAGEAMETAITGNKARLREIAGGMADSLISGLSDLADQFGAELGNATVSVGMRKKSYVVDPTGAGRTKGAGVINFGKDEAAAMEFAIRDAISDGVFVGLSAGIERLLKGEGSLDKQLQKALSLQSVMTEAQNLGNPSGAALAELDKWRTAMIKIVTEAGEGMTEVEAVYANRRTAITEEAAKAVFDAARPRRELEIEIMRLSGKETEALAASRRLELDGMEASIRPLQERAWALQDEADKLAAFKTEREALNIQLWQAMGREDLLRQNALEKLDPLNRSIQEWIWRIEDGNKAAQEAAQAAAEAARATEELAAAQKAAADEMAAKARAIAQERYSLDTQYYQLIGDTVALRARELELLDPSNRARQQEIWAIQDAMAANDAAAKARAEAIKATQDAIRADIDQRNDLIQSYNSQASAIGGLIDRFSGLAASIREFKAGLFGGSGNLGYDAAKAEFQRTSRMAALGNESSLQSFTGSAQAFLSAARDNAGSLVDYQRAIGLVAGASDAAAKGADGVAQQAAQQLNILQAQAAELEALNAQSAAQIEALEKVSTVQANEVAPTLDDLLREQKAAREDSATTRKDQQAEALSMISALNVIASRIARWDRGDYAAVGNDSDTPLTATVSGSVAALITNTGAAEAVPVDTTP